MKNTPIKTAAIVAIYCTAMFGFSGCATVRPERIPGTPVVAAAAVAVYPVMLVAAGVSAVHGDHDVEPLLTFPVWFTRAYLTGELE